MDRRWPISAKGILLRGERVLLLGNERDEWELPGGHVEPGESPEEALVREWQEETGLAVRVERLVDAAFYTPLAHQSVMLLFYHVTEAEAGKEVRLSNEHRGLLWAMIAELPANLPSVYERAVRKSHPASLAERVGIDVVQRLGRDRGRRLERLKVPGAMEPRIGVGEGGQ